MGREDACWKRRRGIEQPPCVARGEAWPAAGLAVEEAAQAWLARGGQVPVDVPSAADVAEHRPRCAWCRG